MALVAEPLELPVVEAHALLGKDASKCRIKQVVSMVFSRAKRRAVIVHPE
jgi:hypothetical protein